MFSECSSASPSERSSPRRLVLGSAPSIECRRAPPETAVSFGRMALTHFASDQCSDGGSGSFRRSFRAGSPWSLPEPWAPTETVLSSTSTMWWSESLFRSVSSESSGLSVLRSCSFVGHAVHSQLGRAGWHCPGCSSRWVLQRFRSRCSCSERHCLWCSEVEWCPNRTAKPPTGGPVSSVLDLGWCGS